MIESLVPIIAAVLLTLCAGLANADGQKLFLTNCATCHGEKGAGDGPAAKAMGAIKPRNFLKDSFKNGDDQISVAKTITDGLPPLMPSWKQALSPDEIKELSEYVLSLRKRHLRQLKTSKKD